MPRIAFLDQNKWIEIARALNRAESPAEARQLAEKLASLTEADELSIPLSLSNILETQKIKNHGRREKLAEVMCRFSKGTVFRPRKQLLPYQLREFFKSNLGLGELSHQGNWFIAPNLPTALMGHGEDDKDLEKICDIYKIFKERALFDYLCSGNRLPDLKQMSARNLYLISQIEKRRTRWKMESLSVRRRAYSAILFYQDQDTIIDVLESVGGSIDLLRENNGQLMLQLSDDVPALFVDRELALKVEAEGRKVTENDLYDFMSFSTVLSYAEIIVGEKASISRIKQANLDKRFPTKLTTSLSDLLG